MKSLNHEIKYNMCIDAVRHLYARTFGIASWRPLDIVPVRGEIHNQVWDQVG